MAEPIKNGTKYMNGGSPHPQHPKEQLKEYLAKDVRSRLTDLLNKELELVQKDYLLRWELKLTPENIARIEQDPQYQLDKTSIERKYGQRISQHASAMQAVERLAVLDARVREEIQRRTAALHKAEGRVIQVAHNNAAYSKELTDEKNAVYEKAMKHRDLIDAYADNIRSKIFEVAMETGKVAAGEHVKSVLDLAIQRAENRAEGTGKPDLILLVKELMNDLREGSLMEPKNVEKEIKKKIEEYVAQSQELRLSQIEALFDSEETKKRHNVLLDKLSAVQNEMNTVTKDIESLSSLSEPIDLSPPEIEFPKTPESADPTITQIFAPIEEPQKGVPTSQEDPFEKK